MSITATIDRSLLTNDVQLFLSLLNQSVIVLQIRVLVLHALLVDVVCDLRELADIFVTEISFCSRFFLPLHSTRCANKVVTIKAPIISSVILTVSVWLMA